MPPDASQDSSARVCFEGRNSASCSVPLMHQWQSMLTLPCLLTGSRLEREDGNMCGHAYFAYGHHGGFPGSSARLSRMWLAFTDAVLAAGRDRALCGDKQRSDTGMEAAGAGVCRLGSCCRIMH